MHLLIEDLVHPVHLRDQQHAASLGTDPGCAVP